jgi:hypothetical protein
VPSSSARTLPIEWVSLSEGMQSSVLLGAGQPPLTGTWVPRITVLAVTALAGVIV